MNREILSRVFLSSRLNLVVLAAVFIVFPSGCGDAKVKSSSTDTETAKLEDETADGPEPLAQEENVDPDSRDRSLEHRENALLENGGNARSEAAVQAGLKWLVAHQAPDGHWSLEGFHKDGKCNCGNGSLNPLTHATLSNDVAATALALLPLLASGETHKGKEGSNRYIKNVESGLKYLLSKQTAAGGFSCATNLKTSNAYAHPMATIVVCEALNLTSDPQLRGPAQRAIDYIVKTQHSAGGWRYDPGQEGDTSVTSWQLMAIKSGQMAGLSYPIETLGRANSFLKVAASPNDDGYRYLPTPKYKDGSLSMTAAGLLCAQYLQPNDLKSASMMRKVDRLAKSPPSPSPHDKSANIYYYYYATQVMFNEGGKTWEAWNPKMRDLLINTQDQGKDPQHSHQKGSWTPSANGFEQFGGRIFMTSLALLTLEIYYRYLPLNRRLEEMAKFSKTDSAKTTPKPDIPPKPVPKKKK